MKKLFWAVTPLAVGVITTVVIGKQVRHNGTPQNWRSMMRNVEDLRDKARLASRVSRLVRIASTRRPSGAYEQAKAEQYTDAEAQSCRFLAIIRRDYGQEVFDKSLFKLEQSLLDEKLEQQAVPAISLLEQFLGDELRITHPQDRGFTLTEYLRDQKPSTIKFGMTIGQFRIYLESGFKCHEVTKTRVRFSPAFSFRIETIDGSVIAKEGWYTLGDYDGLEIDRELQVRNLLDFLAHTIAEDDWSQTCIITLIQDYLAEQGEKMPLYPSRSTDVKDAANAGMVEKVERLTSEMRHQAVEDGVKLQYLTYFDTLVNRMVEEAKSQRRAFDPSIPLIEKQRNGTLSYSWAAPLVIPGKPALKQFNFLLYAQGGHYNFMYAFEKAGYCGSVLFITGNFPSGHCLAETGQLDGLLLHDRIGYSSKEWVLDEVQDTLEERGFKPLPVFISVSWEFDESLAKWLRENFPFD